jgi:hypothetical protein
MTFGNRESNNKSRIFHSCIRGYSINFYLNFLMCQSRSKIKTDKNIHKIRKYINPLCIKSYDF